MVWWISIAVAGITLPVSVVLLGEIVSLEKYVQPAIEMYEEENSTIESQIIGTIDVYPEKEGEKQASSSKNTIETAIANSEFKQELIEKQISQYYDNKKEIAKLKRMMANEDAYRWWLYFGHAKEKCSSNGKCSCG